MAFENMYGTDDKYEDDLNAAIMASLNITDVPRNLLGYVSPSTEVPIEKPKCGRARGTSTRTRATTTRVNKAPRKPRKVVLLDDDDFLFDEPPVKRASTPPRTREEIEMSARSTTRIEQARTELSTIQQPLELVRLRYQELMAELEMVKKEMEVLEETHRVCTDIIEDASAIIEHQNTEMDRATMLDVYGVDVSKPIVNVLDVHVPTEPKHEAEKEPNVPEHPEVPICAFVPTLDGADGEPVKLRFVYPNGTREDHITNSHQTMGVITAFASCRYLRPLRVANIPGVVFTPETTLESVGMVRAALIKFYE